MIKDQYNSNCDFETELIVVVVVSGGLHKRIPTHKFFIIPISQKKLKNILLFGNFQSGINLIVFLTSSIYTNAFFYTLTQTKVYAQILYLRIRSKEILLLFDNATGHKKELLAKISNFESRKEVDLKK